MNIGANIRRLREERGINQYELAAAIGITAGYLSQLERGTKPLNVSTALEIVKALGCELMDLIGNDGSKSA